MSDFDYSATTAKDPTIKVPGAAEGEESMRDQQHEDEALQRADLDRKAARGATEINFATGRLEPVADHLTHSTGSGQAHGDPDGEADGPDDPHVGNAEQSATDDPNKARRASSRGKR